MRPARRVRAARLALAILAPAAVLGLGEALARAMGGGYPTRFLLPSIAGGRPSWVSNSFFGYRFFEPLMARNPAPIRMDRPKAPDRTRVVVLGESAAMGDPAIEFSLARAIEKMLNPPGAAPRFEVINAAMTAISSPVVADIAAEMLCREADMLVVYMGNNEVVGPYGPGAVLAGGPGGDRLTRLRVRLTRLRLASLLSGIVRAAAGIRDRPEGWNGMEMFTRRIASDDPRLESMYRRFQSNLENILSAARRKGAKVLLCTVAVNLADCPPFGSDHGEHMDEATLRGWTEAFQEGATAQGEGRLSAALAAYEKAMQWDGAHAELVYRHARVLAALGREAEAAAGFARARDLDVLRFRADSRLNRIARDTAAREGATLVDLERVLGSTSDSALFLDHVHFTLDGLYRVSREIARGLETWIGPLEIPDRETLFNRLFVTAWSERKHAAIMAQRRARPPFAAQWGNREKLDALNAQMARSTAAIATSDLHRVESAYRELCHEYPDDANYGLQWGQMLCVAHEWEWAARVYGDAIENIHGYSDAHHQAAVALGQAGRPAEAARILLKPGKPYGHYLADFTMLLIQALEKSGQETDARTAAEAVLAGAGRFPGRERVEAWRRKE